MGIGMPPRGGWAMGMVELMVTDHPAPLRFWADVLGFAVVFERLAQKLSGLEHPDGAQMMIYQRDGDWKTGPLGVPFGRGVVIQVYVADATIAAARMATVGMPFYVALRERWRDWGDRKDGQRESLVQDPDADLVMVAERIGERPLPAA